MTRHPALQVRPMTYDEVYGPGGLVERTRTAMSAQSAAGVKRIARERKYGRHGLPRAVSFAEVQSIYQAARRAVPYYHSGDPDPALRIQPWLRKVQQEFDRRLKQAGIPVEGLR